MSSKKLIIIGAFVLIAIILVIMNSKKTQDNSNTNTNTNSNSGNKTGKGNTVSQGNEKPTDEKAIDQNVCYMTSSEIKKLADDWYSQVNHAVVGDENVDAIFNSLKRSNMQTRAEFWAVLSTYSRLYERWFTCVIDKKSDMAIANSILQSKGIDEYFTDNKKR